MMTLGVYVRDTSATHNASLVAGDAIIEALRETMAKVPAGAKPVIWCSQEIWERIHQALLVGAVLDEAAGPWDGKFHDLILFGAPVRWRCEMEVSW